jgi:S1-C subfamily serine protease
MKKGGPAENAGLKVGDQIIAICGVRIEEISDLPSAIFKTRNNQLAPIKVIRGNKELDFSIKAEEAPQNNASE